MNLTMLRIYIYIYTVDDMQDSPLIRPFKGINNENYRFVSELYIKHRVQKLRFLAFSRGPGGFRKLWEAGRNNFHLSWYL